MDMQVGKHFSLDEFTVSQEAARNGIDNTPTKEVIEAIEALCTQILDPLREHFGKPLVISSGYRSPKVNKLVGGVASSQHVLGEAADILVPGVPVADVVAKIRTLKLPFDQLIDEFGKWTHVSYTRNKPLRQEVLAARLAKKKKVYFKIK
jgi:hypothetical protein